MTDLRRDIGFFSCLMLVSGNMIGVGIFTTPGSVAASLGDARWIFAAWAAGAFVALSGALCFAELGTLYPRAGGSYVFLREAYGRPVAFAFGWIFSTMITPGVMGVLSIGFAAYLGFPAGAACKMIAVGAIAALAGLNYFGVRLGALFQDITTSGKIAVMLGLALAGFLWGRPPALAPSMPGVFSAAAFGAALIPVMYTYSGWNAAVLVGGEIRDPHRTIPLGLSLATLLVAGVYLAMNAFYLHAVPVAGMKGDLVIAQTASQNLFGPWASRVTAFLIAVSSLSCLNGTILTGPRIPFAMARDGLFFRAFEWVHPRWQAPGKAILFQAAWAVVLTLTGTFDQLLDWVTVPSLFVSLFCVLGLIRLRHSRPDLERPYRVWGYPWVPVAFVLSVSWILLNAFINRPADSWVGVGLVLASFPLYLIWEKRASTGVRPS